MNHYNNVLASISRPNVSISPIMYNAAFSKLGLDCVYVSFEVSDLKAAMLGVRSMNFLGLSISRPFKEAILPYLDSIDPDAASIGAVNVVKNEGGRWIGYNSDWLGAVSAIERHTGLEGKRVAIVGAGGAGRAIAYGVMTRGASVVLYNRTTERARRVSEELGTEFGGELHCLSAAKGVDVLVNATPVGSGSSSAHEIVPEDLLRASQTVLETVVRPARTELLRRAVRCGATPIRGVEMLVRQGGFAFRLFTGMEPPLDAMFEALVPVVGDA